MPIACGQTHLNIAVNVQLCVDDAHLRSAMFSLCKTCCFHEANQVDAHPKRRFLTYNCNRSLAYLGLRESKLFSACSSKHSLPGF